MSIYRYISAERAHCDLPVSLMCELLGVSESGYWAWCTRPPSDRELADAWLTERIRAIHSASGGRYGSPRVHAMLVREGIRVGEKRVERLMRLAGLRGAHRRRRKGCTVGVEGVEPFRDLVGRNFRPEAPNRVWCADIKQIGTGEGWLYLAAVQDLFNRRIVGWAMKPHMRQELVVDALRMAVAARKPAKGTIYHSDHGSQFIGLTFGQTCHDAGIAQSMGAVGSCFDKRRRGDVFRDPDQGETPARRAVGRLGDPRPAPLGDLRVHRGVLQPDQAAQHARDALPRRVRSRHAAGDPGGLARAHTRAGAREKIVDNLRLSTTTTTKTT